MSTMDQDLCLIKADNDRLKKRLALYNKLRLEDLFCDLNIVVEGKRYPAHRLIMAAASEFFYGKLNDGNEDDESKSTIILDEQVKVRGFEPLIEYAYTGVLTIKYSNIFDVSFTATYLKMIEVSSKIRSYYQQSVQQVHQMQQRQQQQLGAHNPASAALLARLFNQGLLPHHPHHPAAAAAPHHPAHLHRMQLGVPASASPVQPAPNPAGLDAVALMAALAPDARRFLPGMHRHQFAAHKLPPPPEQQQIDPVQLQEMRRYAAEMEETNLHRHQQQQRFVQSMAAARPSKEAAVRQMVATGNENVRSNSADQLVMNKPSSAENGSPSPSSRNIDGSGETAEVRAKRGRSCDAVIQINGKNEGSLENDGAKDSLTEKRKDEEASCSYDLSARSQHQITPPIPSLLAPKQAASPPTMMPTNGQLMALLQPHQSVNFANGCSDKAGKAIVDEFANTVLSQNMGKPETYDNLMKRFGGNENVINLLKTQKQHASSWYQRQQQHAMFMKQHVSTNSNNNNSNANNNNNRSSSNNGASQREVDLPDLPPSGRYSTVRRRTLQSNKPKPHECKICGSTFTRYHNLKQHVKLHSGIKPFQCKICFKRFTRNYTLKLHVDKHQNVHHQHRANVGSGIGGVPSGLGAEYRCQVCLASFDDATSFEIHLTQSGHQQVIASPDDDDNVSIDEIRGYHHHYRPPHQYASSSSSPPSPQDMDDAVASAGAGTTGAFYSIRKDSMVSSPPRPQQQEAEEEPKVGGGEGRNKVRYGLDSPGDSSGDTMTNPGSNSPPRGGDSEIEDDESPTDLSVVRKRSSDDNRDIGDSLQIDESAGQDLRTNAKKIKVEMSA